ncbi:GNAT family N-acetyltransferase [Acutalibacter caecimuris]|uniref:GNAT family N-acetyltransferase n=1 Tax=Acutalibacter caecimuris TaxID=3093657 RepID=UPI002AC922CE|nr:GNAT family N-acetyltransferase [Acutalibacter sp. M00118]
MEREGSGRPDGLAGKVGETEIVAMEADDAQVLALFSEHDDFMLDKMGEDSHYYTRYNQGENIERAWVAYVDGFPAGCIAYRKREDGAGEVKRLHVRQRYRGRGLSKSLLKTLESHARGQGCQKLYLDTRSNLEPAVSLYRAFGFRAVFQQGLYMQMEKAL